jgi:hypothetical protein
MCRGAPTWFETVWNYSVEAIDYWTIFSMKAVLKFGSVVGVVVGNPWTSHV